MPSIDTDMLVCTGLILPWDEVIGLQNVRVVAQTGALYINVLLRNGSAYRIDNIACEYARHLFDYYFERIVIPRMAHGENVERVRETFWRAFSGEEADEQ